MSSKSIKEEGQRPLFFFHSIFTELIYFPELASRGAADGTLLRSFPLHGIAADLTHEIRRVLRRFPRC